MLLFPTLLSPVAEAAREDSRVIVRAGNPTALAAADLAFSCWTTPLNCSKLKAGKTEERRGEREKDKKFFH